VVILNWNQVVTLNWNWVVNITGICSATSKIWYYDVTPPYKLTKNKPIAYEHMQEFVELFKNPTKRNHTNNKTVEGCNDWTISVEGIVDYDISAKNPHKVIEVEHLTPTKLLSKIKDNDKKINDFMNQVESLIHG
jgi:type I restriction enzyme M protein